MFSLKLVTLSVFFFLMLLIILLAVAVSKLVKFIALTPNKEFRLISYYVPEPFDKGHLRFVIECKNTGLQKEYFINEGKLYFGGYVNKQIKTGEENKWVGGISCTPPLFKQ